METTGHVDEAREGGRPVAAPGRRAGPFLVREIGYRPNLHQPPHRHERASLTLLLRGQIRETTRHGEEFGSPLSLVMKPPGVEHADEVGPDGAHTLQIAFPADGVPDLVDRAPELDRWQWLHGRPEAAPFLELLRVARTPEPPTDEMEDRVLEALSAVGEAAGPAGDGSGEEPSSAGNEPPPWLARMKEAIDDDPAGAPRVRELADSAGIHPVTASRAFRRRYGHTVTEYRRRTRLRRAATRIAGTDSDLSRIAFAAGYADHPHLCREFRRATGLTPSAFRRLAREA